MTQIIWPTIVEIRDDSDKSVLVQEVDWCCQAAEPTSTESRYTASPGHILV